MKMSKEVPIIVGDADLAITERTRKETADATVAFFNVYRERSKPPGTLPVFHVQDRHNHVRLAISSSIPCLPLSGLMPQQQRLIHWNCRFRTGGTTVGFHAVLCGKSGSTNSAYAFCGSLT